MVVACISSNNQNSFTIALSPSYNHHNARKVASTKSTFVTPLTHSSQQQQKLKHRQHQHQLLLSAQSNNENGNDLVVRTPSRVSITSLKDSRSDSEVTVVDGVDVVVKDEGNDIYKTAIRRTLFLSLIHI